MQQPIARSASTALQSSATLDNLHAISASPSPRGSPTLPKTDTSALNTTRAASTAPGFSRTEILALRMLLYLALSDSDDAARAFVLRHHSMMELSSPLLISTVLL